MKEALSPSVMRRAGFSIGLLVLYYFGQRIPIPFLTFSEGGMGIPEPSLSLFSLGFHAFVIGFLLVELFSLLIPLGRRLRRRGIQGRRTLQRAAFGMSLLVVGVQAFGIHQFFLRVGLIETSSPRLTRLWMIAGLVAGAALLYWLATKATDFGLVNGFALLYGYGVVTGLLRSSLNAGESAELETPSESLMLYWVLLIAAGIGLWRFLVSPATVTVTDSDLDSHRVEVPPFPTSIVPASIVILLWNLPFGSSLGSSYLDLPVEPEESGLPIPLVFLGILLGIPLLSWLGYWIFSHWKRLESNLIPPAVGILGDGREVLWQRFLLATVILTAGPLLFEGLYWFTSRPLMGSLYFTQLVMLTALVVDLVDQVRLGRRGKTVKLLDLDNVHLAAYLKALFRSEGIAMEIQGYHFRRLLFFFGPLYKMQVRVAQEDEDRAWEILEDLEVAVI